MRSFRLLNEDSVLKTSKIRFKLNFTINCDRGFLFTKIQRLHFASQRQTDGVNSIQIWGRTVGKNVVTCAGSHLADCTLKRQKLCKQKHHWSDPLTRCDFVFPLQVKIKFKNCCLYAADSSAGSVSEVNKEATLKGRSAKFKSCMCWLLRVKWRSFSPPLLIHWH